MSEELTSDDQGNRSSRGLEIDEDSEEIARATQLALAYEEEEDSTTKKGVVQYEDDDRAPVPDNQILAFHSKSNDQHPKKTQEINEDDHSPQLGNLSTESHSSHVTPREIHRPSGRIQYGTMLPPRPPQEDNDESETTAPSVPALHVLEATLVQRETVYSGVQVETDDAAPRPWWKRHVRFVGGGLIGLVIGLAIAFGASFSFGSNSDTNNGESNNSLTPQSDEASIQPSKSSRPSSQSSQSHPPSQIRSRQTAKPTLMPTKSPKVFKNRDGISFLTFEDGNADPATFSSTSGTFKQPEPNPDASDVNPSTNVAFYVQDQGVQWDWLAFWTDAIADASSILNGRLSFTMDVFTDDAPNGTDIMITLANMPLDCKTYPIGRHSQYIAFTTTSGKWEKLQFAFIGQPDPTVPNNLTNGIVMTFAGGSFNQDAFYIDNLVVQ